MKRMLLLFSVIALLLPASAPPGAAMPEVLSPLVYVADAAQAATPLFNRAGREQGYPGSTTKIMTALLVLENCRQDETVKISAQALKLPAGSSLMGIAAGESYTVEELLYGLMLVSGNDAAEALAMHVDGTVAAFAQRMNERAAQLGMTDSHFVNPHGIYSEEHYSTARDMALLTAAALKNPDFAKLFGTAAILLPATKGHKKSFNLKNANRLISDSKDSELYFEDAIGGKTGTTPKGGRALVAAARRGGVTIICVQMGLVGTDADLSARVRRSFTDCIALFSAAFSGFYRWADAGSLPAYSQSYEQDGLQYRLSGGGRGTAQAQEVLSPQAGLRLVPNEPAENPQLWETRVALFAPLSGELPAGSAVGELKYVYRGELYFTLPVFLEKIESAVPPQPSPSPANTAQKSDPRPLQLLAQALLAAAAVSLLYFAGRGRKGKRGKLK